VHALRNIHTALAPDGLLVDTQPISSQPRVAAEDVELGRLDMREWVGTIRAVDERFAEMIAAGLYELQHEGRLTVTDSFDDGRECLETVSGWRDTNVPTPLASRLEATHGGVTVEQDIRLRLLRCVTATAAAGGGAPQPLSRLVVPPPASDHRSDRDDGDGGRGDDHGRYHSGLRMSSPGDSVCASSAARSAE
jgi:hypothetical protein